MYVNVNKHHKKNKGMQFSKYIPGYHKMFRFFMHFINLPTCTYYTYIYLLKFYTSFYGEQVYTF